MVSQLRACYITNPDEVTSAIAWLCSLGASYITVQTIIVDGGNSILEERG
ncbi:MAG: SDR family oxidoreductase [Candidatus Nanopelagicaceae bacterium]|nr:SDR family oxidoreductase [Candidatus Nanopelagicaceae bacterium]